MPKGVGGNQGVDLQQGESRQGRYAQRADDAPSGGQSAGDLAPDQAAQGEEGADAQRAGGLGAWSSRRTRGGRGTRLKPRPELPVTLRKATMETIQKALERMASRGRPAGVLRSGCVVGLRGVARPPPAGLDVAVDDADGAAGRRRGAGRCLPAGRRIMITMGMAREQAEKAQQSEGPSASRPGW